MCEEYGSRMVLSEPGWGPIFYVCPRTGLLRERKLKAWRAGLATPDGDLRWEGAHRALRQIDGIWYAFEMARVPGESRRAGVRDRFLARPLETLAAATLEATWGRPGLYAASKRQLSKRELASRKLKNGPQTKASRA